MKRRNAILAATGLSLGAWCAPAARASYMLTNPDVTAGTRVLSDYSLGEEITVGASPVSVSALGYFDYTGSTFIDTHVVGIYSSSRQLIAEVTLTAGNNSNMTLADSFLYASLSTPITLNAEGNYWLIGETGTGTTSSTNDPIGDSDFSFSGSYDTITQSPDFVSYYEAYLGGDNGVLQCPETTRTTPNSEYFGPNLQYTLVPEPASLVLVCIPLAGLWMRRRRSQCAT